EEVAEGIVDTHIDEKTDSSEWDLEDLNENLEGVFGITIDASSGNTEALTERIVEDSWKRYEEKVENVGDKVMSEVEKMLMLITIDNLWKDHLLTMDHLKGGIGLRGYGQKNPLNEYKREGFELFAEMLFRMKGEVAERLFKVKVEPAGAADTMNDIRPKEQAMTYGRDEVASAQSQGGDGEGQQRAEKQRPVRRAVDKVGRNEPCPCGSGKKYKKCCDKDNS
ncbi:MAG: SEC-C domain-containing protein, partial [Deltaproteobacteria bacterium]|nr:SEC-C domain-containing protein [Deltaproteobacteria bacterium]